MKRLTDEEDLNLQDLIFILLFFFVISQTLIVFKVQKDLIVPPKVDKDPETMVEEQGHELINIVIDERSTVSVLTGEVRIEVIRGFAEEAAEDYVLYCDPEKGKNLFLDAEGSGAYKALVAAVQKLKTESGYRRPRVGLVADHRARYGAIFQVNVGVQELIRLGEVDPSVRWKVYVDKSGGRDNIFREALRTGQPESGG